MKRDEVDICERGLVEEFGEGVFGKLLLDHTTGRNIYWATDSYAGRGEGFGFRDEIAIGRICGEERVIRPRAVKSREEQAKRVKDKAEVFTPSWVCNLQNNLVDEAWFGKKGVFNSPDKKDPHGWKVNADPVKFPEGKTWMDYVTDVRMEISCGEAPYLVSRYDTVTGEPIALERRIGIIDRKLRVVSENVKESGPWISWAKLAYATTYGFEYQGDNLLLAREAMFISFKEYYAKQFGKAKISKTIAQGLAYIISWNLWQMDAFTMGLPGYGEELKKREAAEEKFRKELEAYEKSKQNTPLMPLAMPEPLGEREWFERYCTLKNFKAVNIRMLQEPTRRPVFGDSVPRCEFRELAAEKK